jgi:hypothetical protein
MNGQRHLRLVEPPPPQARRLYETYETRIVVSSARLGRSRTFRLTESDIDELIAHAERLERRRA